LFRLSEITRAKPWGLSYELAYYRLPFFPVFVLLVIQGGPMLPLAPLYVVLDGLAGGGAHGSIEVFITPEGFTPELRLDSIPAFLAYPPRARPLEALHDLAHTVVLAGLEG